MKQRLKEIRCVFDENLIYKEPGESRIDKSGKEEEKTQESKKCEDKGKRRFRFEFTMRDVIKEHYRDLPNQNGGVFLPEVKMIRDGESRGFPFVEPWIVDILLIPDRRFPMFATSFRH